MSGTLNFPAASVRASEATWRVVAPGPNWIVTQEFVGKPSPLTSTVEPAWTVVFARDTFACPTPVLPLEAADVTGAVVPVAVVAEAVALLDTIGAVVMAAVVTLLVVLAAVVAALVAAAIV